MHEFGLIRVGLAAPRAYIADPSANASAVLELIGQAADCDLLVFPELCLTGYTCADLFQQRTLQEASTAELGRILQKNHFSGLLILGMPLGVFGRLYNVAVVVQRDRLLGILPKQHIPNYKEFYEHRWFTPPRGDEPATIKLCGQEVAFGTDLLFRCDNMADLVVGVEICEDLWVPIPPSCHQAQAGATVLVNISASNESTGKADYRKQLVLNQSARCIAGYLYASCGVHESTTDVVFGGHSIAAESGTLLAESKRFLRAPNLLRADVDVERLSFDRRQMNTFADGATRTFRNIRFLLSSPKTEGLHRPVHAHPFVPSGTHRLEERCEEIFSTQVAGLARRLEQIKPRNVQIGVSGGLDSTLALLVTTKTYDLLGWDRECIRGITMPGFGTGDRTYSNALRLMELLKISAREIPIRQLSKEVFEALGHQPFGIDTSNLDLEQMMELLHQVPEENLHDLVFENVQARVRTLILMSHGFVIGTGDLSEMALGWSTYNGDHMSMYNVNASIPKTLVRFLIGWAAEHEFDGETREILRSIIATEISPELLPAGPQQSIQSTEGTIGPYELHDFFLYHLVRFGYRPRKILWLASFAHFDKTYTQKELHHWLRTFCQRFFAAQYKRSCVPDGPKVGSISLSPRGDWRMPSDAQVAIWLADLETEPA